MSSATSLKEENFIFHMWVELGPRAQKAWSRPLIPSCFCTLCNPLYLPIRFWSACSSLPFVPTVSWTYREDSISLNLPTSHNPLELFSLSFFSWKDGPDIHIVSGLLHAGNSMLVCHLHLQLVGRHGSFVLSLFSFFPMFGNMKCLHSDYFCNVEFKINLCWTSHDCFTVAESILLEKQ